MIAATSKEFKLLPTPPGQSHVELLLLTLPLLPPDPTELIPSSSVSAASAFPDARWRRSCRFSRCCGGLYWKFARLAPLITEDGCSLRILPTFAALTPLLERCESPFDKKASKCELLCSSDWALGLRLRLRLLPRRRPRLLILFLVSSIAGSVNAASSV